MSDAASALVGNKRIINIAQTKINSHVFLFVVESER